MDEQLDRIIRLQSGLRRRHIDGLLVSQPDNRRYLSGYTAPDHGIQESSGLLLIPAKGRPYLLTDARFTLQAEAEAQLFLVELYSRGLLPLLERLINRLGLQSLAFESDYLLHSTFQGLAGMANKRGLTLVPQLGLIEAMREVKSADELELLRASTRLNETVFQSVYATIEPGMTEREIALALELTMREMGAEGPSFPTIVAFGTNAARPHAVPTDRELQAGDLVLIDMGLIHRGYCSDMTRTFVAGRPDRTYIDRHRVVRVPQQDLARGPSGGQRGRGQRRQAEGHAHDAQYPPDLGGRPPARRRQPSVIGLTRSAQMTTTLMAMSTPATT